MIEIDKRGIILDKEVDIEWLKELQPQFFDDFIKFVINKDTSKVCVGMLIHKNCQEQIGSNLNCLYGGNLFWDGSVVWESTLNVIHNVKAGIMRDEMRILGDPDTIAILGGILHEWVRF